MFSLLNLDDERFNLIDVNVTLLQVSLIFYILPVKLLNEAIHI